MRLPCPICGERDAREFSYQGVAEICQRPSPDAGEAAWESYLHLRGNPAGPTRELWYHEAGCTAWIVVERDTVTHQIHGATLASEARS